MVAGIRPAAALAQLFAAAALTVTGCSGPTPQPSTSAPVSTAPDSPAVEPAPLPPPEALTGVIYRMADPAVPGIEKVHLVEGGSAADAAALERFAAALRDGGFAPASVSATGIAPGTRPGEVVAIIEVTPEEPGDRDRFSFPMGFRPAAGGWQLTRETADLLFTAP